jgi:hypothetical protein
LDAVLDLAREAELLDICRATDCTPWNMIEIPTTPATSTVANPAAPACRPPTDWPILGNTKRNTKQSRNGWMIVRRTKSLVLAQHDDVAQQQRPSAVRWLDVDADESTPRSRGGCFVAHTVAQLLAGQIDEDGLE